MTPTLLARADTTIATANRLLSDYLALDGARTLAYRALRDGHELLAEASIRALAIGMGPLWAATLLEDWAQELREEHERQVWAALPRGQAKRRDKSGKAIRNMRERVEEAVSG